MAKPSPSAVVYPEEESLAVLMPMICPSILTRGPPELPEFRAALVCIRVMVRSPMDTSRLMPQMMPSVMVPRSSIPRGSPMATTLSPTSMALESPNSAAVSPVALILSTVKSEVSSPPTWQAAYSCPSVSRTEICCAEETT